jgi:anti-sigma regulatory factor (Ser/Thr protein kinase)
MKNEHPDRDHELTLDLPAAHSAVRVARHVVRHFARMQGVKDSEIEQLVLMVSELLANAIDHGGGAAAMNETELDGDPRMKLAFTLREHDWTLTVSDQGGGDPERVKKLLGNCRDGVPDLDDDRGRGLFLMAQMVDSLDVEKSADGRGLTFRIVRRHDGS